MIEPAILGTNSKDGAQAHTNEAAIQLPNSSLATQPLFNATAVIQLVEAWEDTMDLRKVFGNRIGAVERAGAEPAPGLVAAFERLQAQEAALKKEIVCEWREHPLAPWAREVRGLGEHSAAVLVAYLNGDPYIAFPKRWAAGEGDVKRVLVSQPPRPRTVAQLRAYCGYGEPLLKRKRGMSQDEALALGNPKIKSRLYLIALSFMKEKPNEYTDLYYEARESYRDRVHSVACAQCHAKPGDLWKPGHQHAAALRFVIKRFLKDLWIASRDLHEARTGHSALGLHNSLARAGQIDDGFH